jgi:gas vesicle protein
MKNSLGLLLFGAAIGIAAGVLMAPSKGSDTRKKVLRGAEDWMDRLKDQIRDSSKKINDYAEIAEERIDALNKKIRAMEKATV